MIKHNKALTVILAIVLFVTNLTMMETPKVEAASADYLVNEINLLSEETEYDLLFKPGRIKVILPINVDQIGLLNYSIEEVDTDYHQIKASVFTDVDCTKAIDTTLYMKSS